MVQQTHSFTRFRTLCGRFSGSWWWYGTVCSSTVLISSLLPFPEDSSAYLHLIPLENWNRKTGVRSAILTSFVLTTAAQPPRSIEPIKTPISYETERCRIFCVRCLIERTNTPPYRIVIKTEWNRGRVSGKQDTPTSHAGGNKKRTEKVVAIDGMG